MKPTTTRTLNPLPFQDLEPHRFEDLVRQLAYDLRPWRSLEPLGRTGSDEGLDIRRVEVVRLESDADDEGDEPAFEERLWVIQCKRERTISPKRVRAVVAENLDALPAPPYGYVLAIAAVLSRSRADQPRPKHDATIAGSRDQA